MAYSSKKIRNEFIEFFKKKQHEFVRSSSVVPSDDPTLLFTNAGMNQFKPIFLGQQEKHPLRAVNSQKCIRVSGKHNDLEEVGVDEYHHTFFEMLGNWSFGDYYKKEAIEWAWELLTEVWKLDKSRLWVTIFEDDDEAGELWKKHTDVAPERVLKFGHKDNFWEMGDTGPCGPCSEIHYYSGDDPENQSADGVNALHDYREIWNLVFIQTNRDAEGKLHDLPHKHVDTGAGFERLTALLNGVTSNYDTDLFIPIIEKIAEMSGVPAQGDDAIPHRVIADHLRMLSFSIADGAMPGNEGRGYVLRRVLRRASRFGRKLGMKQAFIFELIDTLCNIMGEAFPELLERREHIRKVIRAEEMSFNETLDRGLEIFDRVSTGLKSGNTISGDDAFLLYDTYGFPLDLTELLAREQKLNVDVDGFDKCMTEQKNRARKAGKFKMESDDTEWTELKPGDSRFMGYEKTQCQCQILSYRESEKGMEIVLDDTPFYAEKGGQCADTGMIRGEDFDFRVDYVRDSNQKIVHLGKLLKGDPKNAGSISATIDTKRRDAIRRNHSATHLLHKALKMVLGEHVQQAGSLVEADRLRFDLTHYEQITPSQIAKIEGIVNSEIRANWAVETDVKSYDDAKAGGAVALFGEKYGDEVRVVSMGGFSQELCGGTHVHATGDIGYFRVISESALAAGIRRLQAVSGVEAVELAQGQTAILNALREQLRCTPDSFQEKIDQLMTDKKNLEKELSELKKAGQGDALSSMLKNADNINDHLLIVDTMDSDVDLKTLGDAFRSQVKSGAVVFGQIKNGKVALLCALSDDLLAHLKAGDVVKQIAKLVQGGGGGKSHMATAGGKNAEKLPEALQFARDILTKELEKI